MIVTKKLIRTCDTYNIPILRVLSNIKPDGNLEAVERLCLGVDTDRREWDAREKLWRSDMNSIYYEWVGSLKSERASYLQQKRKDIYEEYKEATGVRKLALEKRIMELKRIEDGKVVVDDAMIHKAKQYPIENILGPVGRSGKYKCVFHNDTNPSLHYYPKTNSVHCFSCSGGGGDAIDVYMAVHAGVSFREAVLTLSEGSV